MRRPRAEIEEQYLKVRPGPKSHLKTTESRKIKTSGYRPADMRMVFAQTKIMMSDGDWSECRARHLIALHALLHERVYGFLPATSSEDRARAAWLISRVVKDHFGDYAAAVDFVRWTWSREWERKKKRDARGEPTRSPIGLRLQFHGSLIDDYRLARAQRKARA